MVKLLIKFIFLTLLAIIVFNPLFVLSETKKCDLGTGCDSDYECHCDPKADDNKEEGICAPKGATVICPPTKYTKIEELIESISNWIFYIALVLAPLMFILGGGYLITAAGDENRVKTGKSIITWTIIGLVVIFMVKIFIQAIRFVLGV